MKTIYLLLAFVLLLGCPCLAQEEEQEPKYGESGTSSHIDVKNGFRDVQLGQKVKAGVGGWRKVAAEDGITYMVRAGEKLQLGTAKLQSVTYLVFDNRVMGILIVSMGKAAKERILEALQILYGEGVKENPFIEEYKWIAMKNRLRFHYNEFSTKTEVVFLGEVRNEYEQSRERDAEAAKNDL